MATLYLIVRIAGQRVALSAAPVESVVEIDTLTPVPRAAPHIAGLAALRSRVLTIVDCLQSLELGPSPRGDRMHTVIVTIESQQYGLLVEDVIDVVPLEGAARPVNLALEPAWAHSVTGIVEHEGEALLVIDPAVFIAGPVAVEAA